MDITYRFPHTNAYIREDDNCIELCCNSYNKGIKVIATYSKDDSNIYIHNRRSAPKTKCFKSFKEYLISRNKTINNSYAVYEHSAFSSPKYHEKYMKLQNYINDSGEIVFYTPFHNSYVIESEYTILFNDCGGGIALYIKDQNVIQCHNAVTNTVRGQFKWFADFICHKINSEKVTVWLATYDQIRTIEDLDEDELIKYGIFEESDFEDDDEYEEDHA